MAGWPHNLQSGTMVIVSRCLLMAGHHAVCGSAKSSTVFHKVVQPGMPSFQPLRFWVSATTWLGRLRCQRVPRKDLPVVKHTGGSLATGAGVQSGCETEGLIDRQVGLDHEHGHASHLGLLKHNDHASC